MTGNKPGEIQNVKLFIYKVVALADYSVSEKHECMQNFKKDSSVICRRNVQQ